MINKVIRETMDLLIDEKGFFLEEFHSIEEELNFYLYTPIKNGFLAVIFSTLGKEDENLLAFMNHARLNGIPAYILNIVFTGGHPVPLKEKLPNYSEVYVDEEGKFFGHDDVSRSVLSRKVAVKQKMTLRSMAVTFTLMILNIVIYTFTAIKSGGLDIDIFVLIRYGAKVNELIQAGAYYRLFTSAFLHADFMHVLFNMYALFALGRIVEEFMGKWKMLGIYCFSAVTGGMLSYLYTPNVAVGASGAIFGLLGAILVITLFGKKKSMKSMFSRIMIVLAINLFSGFTSSNIDNFGHIGGLLGGIVITALILLLSRRPKENG
ncbi:rhomboid family intramembrane serine protease [Proteiniclasticum sp. C24MP]|uniref:rhomboid family intramembrane serine protease n=1 Tax=Proteiniclasticum sp. C24MP TaxID=3374101 RepID=UPI003754B7B8